VLKKQSKQLERVVKGKPFLISFTIIPNSFNFRICIIAADISPIDVLSHLPILCEDKNIAYIYVKSRAEIGDACKTKRPTSCVLIQLPGKKSSLESKFKKLDESIRAKNKYMP